MQTLLITILICLFTAPCLAGNVDTTATTILPIPAQVLSETDITYGLVARMVFSLLVVLILIWGAVQVLRRISKTPGKDGSSHIQVLDRAYLAPKRAVYVVKIGNRPLALGVTDDHITTLAELDPEETGAAYPENESRTHVQSFAHLFNNIRSRWEEKRA